MNEQIRINWRRTPVDKAAMSKLMARSDARALAHCLLHLGLFALTTAASYFVYSRINAVNWAWTAPALVLCLFLHGTFAAFMGGTATHELCHKTPFHTQWLNEFFLRIFSFLSWFDFVGYRLSHVKHHQATVHRAWDGEVILPQKLDWSALGEDELVLPKEGLTKFVLLHFLPVPNLFAAWRRLVHWVKFARGRLEGMGMYAGGVDWMNQMLPANKTDARRRHRNWARAVVGGHLALAALFAASGHWFLIVPVCLSSTHAGWLSALCGLPQHIGMGPDVPDFRLCCRTFTCHPFLGFLYWNMQYHVEHHMFPAVPFYRLPALRVEIAHDLPPAPHGLLATWREIIPILQRQTEEPGYCYVPQVAQA